MLNFLRRMSLRSAPRDQRDERAIRPHGVVLTMAAHDANNIEQLTRALLAIKR